MQELKLLWRRVKTLPDGRLVDVYPIIHGNARMTVGDGHFCDDTW